MKNINSTDFEQRCYFFSVNTISFVKSMQKAGFQDEKSLTLMKFAGSIGTKILDAYDIEDEKTVENIVVECKKLAENCHNLFQNIRCGNDKLLLKEKAELQIDALKLSEDFEKFLQ